MIVSKKKILRDSFIYTILPKISAVATLATLPIISPYLSLEDYGIYGLVMSYVAIFQIVIVLGQNVVLQNSFFEYGRRYFRVWQKSFGLMTLAGILAAVLFSALFYWGNSSISFEQWYTISILISLYLVLSPIESIAVNYFVLKERPLPFAICSAITGFASAAVAVIAIRFFKIGFMGWIIVLPLNGIIMYAFFFRILFLKEQLYPSFRISKRFSKKALTEGLPLTPHQVSMYVLAASDRLILEYFRVPIVQIGYYSQGYNLASYGNLFINGVFQSLAKKMQEAFRGNEDSNREFLRKLMIIATVSISAVLFIASLWIKDIFVLLFKKKELQDAYPITIIVLSSYMYWSIYTFFTYPLSIRKKTFSISKISITAAIINILGNIILIPHFGIWAALGVTYLSYVIFGFAGLLDHENRVFMERYINVKKLCLFLFIINVSFFGISFSVMDSSWVTKAALTVFLCLASFFSLRKYVTVGWFN